MSILESRIEKMREKKTKRSRRATITIVSVITTALLITAGIGTLVVHKYITTKQWDKNAIQGTYADMVPEFAKNHISADMLDDVNSLSSINPLLKKIKTQNGVNDSTISDAEKELAKSKKILNKYKIVSGDAFDTQTELELYINIYKVEKNAYTKPDSQKLSEVMTTLSNRLVEKEQKVDQNIMVRLNQLANTYNNLNTFVDSYTVILGTDSNGVLSVSKDLMVDKTTEMLDEIKVKGLEKFPNIKNIQGILTSSKWDKIMANNAKIKEKEAWSEVYAVFSALTKDQYVKVSDISTYEKAKTYDVTISGLTPKTGYIITDDSSVDQVLVNGQIVNESDYIKISGNNVEVVVDPTYEKDPNYVEPKIEEIEESTDFDESSTSSSSSYIDSSTRTETSSSSSVTYPSSSSTPSRTQSGTSTNTSSGLRNRSNN